MHLTVSGLTKSYGSVRALEGVSFDAPPGACVGILGPNGAGKSTLLHCLAGLLESDTGVITLTEGQRSVPIRDGLGFAPDDLPMPDLLSGKEYLRMMTALRGLRLTDDDHLAMFATFRLEKAINRLLGDYSHGMRRKLSLLGAVAHHPGVLVLDEPLRGLDPESSAVIKRVVRTWRESGRCVVLSTHDLLVAQQLCDRILILAEGQAVSFGTTQELCQLAGRATLEEAFLVLTGLESHVEDLAEEMLSLIERSRG